MLEFLASDLFTNILLYCLPILGGFLYKLAAKHLRWKRGQEILFRLGELAGRAVLAVQSEYVSQITKANEDGILTAEEKIAAKKLAIAKLQEYCNLRELEYVLGSRPRVDVALNDALEASLETMKRAGILPRQPK